jgi:hypothetical protein
MSTTTDIETVTVGRVTYEVTRTERPETIPYELHGPRGAHYGLMRNAHRPEMLFLFNMKGFTKHSPDWWFTDRDGSLEFVR